MRQQPQLLRRNRGSRWRSPPRRRRSGDTSQGTPGLKSLSPSFPENCVEALPGRRDRASMACPLSPARGRSPFERCATLACAASSSIARTIIAATRSRSAQTNGLITFGSPISKRGSHAKPAAREALTSGRTLIGTSRRSRRWAIVSVPVRRKPAKK
jgi:hypothetical protein